jgi:hypothetical protein
MAVLKSFAFAVQIPGGFNAIAPILLPSVIRHRRSGGIVRRQLKRLGSKPTELRQDK